MAGIINTAQGSTTNPTGIVASATSARVPASLQTLLTPEQISSAYPTQPDTSALYSSLLSDVKANPGNYGADVQKLTQAAGGGPGSADYRQVMNLANAASNKPLSYTDVSSPMAHFRGFDASGNPVYTAGVQLSDITNPNAAASSTSAAPLSNTSVPSATPATVASPSPWNITANQTVQGQLAGIVDPNNPLMVQAKTQADEAANQRGLINSSMAVSAGQDAMYRAALPIASSDAATYAKAAGYNADQINQVNSQNAQLQNQAAIANLNANTNLVTTNMSTQTQRDVAALGAESQQKIAAMNADSSQKIAALDASSRAQLQQLQNQNATLLNTNQQASQAFNQYVVAAANIQNNPNLDAANKTAALQSLWHTTQAQLTVLAHVSGLDLTSMLDMTGLNAPMVPASPAPAATPAPTAAPVTSVPEAA